MLLYSLLTTIILWIEEYQIGSKKPASLGIGLLLFSIALLLAGFSGSLSRIMPFIAFAVFIAEYIFAIVKNK